MSASLPEWAPSPQWSREWLATNGIGGFASGTVAGAVSRRYHAFLCAATRAPQERRVLVTKIEETLVEGEDEFPLGANFWPHTLAPRGDLLLESFALDPLPRWVYRVPTAAGVLRLQKTVWMPQNANTTVARYVLLEGSACELQVRAFVAPRDYHTSHHQNDGFNVHLEEREEYVSLHPYDAMPTIVLGGARQFCPSGHWYLDFQWPIEAERGLDSSEDAWNPGLSRWDLKVGDEALFYASTEVQSSAALRETEGEAIERARALGGGGQWHETGNRLRRAADQFIVSREDGLHTVLAGYPWFTDWGRDTMIALPGLCLTTQRFDIAASILRSFAGTMSQGMIPNRFPEGDETPDYNTVDGTLWFFHAVAQYAHLSGDWETTRELYPKLVESIEWHLAGTRYGIMADDDDGLLRAGDATSQLTWMDAKIGDVAFTPRAGKPVEIQALWFNALTELALMARRFGDEATAGICVEWHRKVAAHFPILFWNEAENCLYDFIDGSGANGYRDGAIRPNQIFAVSLPHRLLTHNQELGVVAAVERELLTPHGMRSLSPRDSRYRGRYEGNAWARDSAYHQGTAWGWLTGPFCEAYLKVHGDSQGGKAHVRAWLAPLIAHMDETGLDQISEIFDGDAPHAPRGCFAQAWSVAETLRLWELCK